MSAIYLDEQGAELHKRTGVLVVEVEGKEIARIPEAQIDRLVIVGNVQITTQALAFLLDRGIPTSFVTTHGRYRGKLMPVQSRNIPIRYQQFRRHPDKNWRLDLSRRIVRGKILNCRSLLLRHRRNHPEIEVDGEIAATEMAATKVDQANSTSSLMGIEGSAAAAHFCALGKMVRKEFTFDKRSKRPPRDPVNSLISFGYSLLCNEVLSALASAGFDPFLGFFHDIQYGRPSLAVDMMEEFRYAVDALALLLVNKGMLKEGDFVQGKDGGFYLTEEGRKVFFVQYEKKLVSCPEDPTDQESHDYRGLFVRQTQRLVDAVGGTCDYQPHEVK